MVDIDGCVSFPEDTWNTSECNFKRLRSQDARDHLYGLSWIVSFFAHSFGHHFRMCILVIHGDCIIIIHDIVHYHSID